jgi:bacillithiol system protein YtxJ
MALPWSKATHNVPEIDTIEDYASLMNEELVVVFKHSPTCPVSWMAHREVLQYQGSQPHVPLYLVSVRRRREVARHIADQTGIQHESPQIIVLRRGTVVGSASHDEITSEAIAGFVGSGSPGEVSSVEIIGSPQPVPNGGS